MECIKCGATHDEGYLYCLACGHRLDGKKECSSCESPIPNTADFCPMCGKRQAAQTRPVRARTFKPSWESVGDALEHRIAKKVRAAVMLAISLIIFLASFGTSFIIKMPIAGGYTTLDIEVRQSNIQLLGAFFSIQNGYDEEKLSTLMQDVSNEMNNINMYGDMELAVKQIGRIMSKINLYKLSVTENELTESSGIGTITVTAIDTARAHIAIMGTLALIQMIAGFGFAVVFLLELILGKNIFGATFAAAKMSAIAILSALVFSYDPFVSLGYAVTLPLAMSLIALGLLTVCGILKANKQIPVRALIHKAVTVPVALIIILCLSFAPVNNINVTYPSYSQKYDRIYSAPIVSFSYISAFSINEEEAGDGMLSAISASFQQQAQSNREYLQSGDGIFVALSDEEYLVVYSGLKTLFALMPFLYLSVTIILIWQLISAVYCIAQNKYRKQDWISQIPAIALASFMLIISILFKASVNEALIAVGISILTVSLGSGIIATLILGAVLLTGTLIFNYFNREIYKKSKKSKQQEIPVASQEQAQPEEVPQQQTQQQEIFTNNA